jgi:hypothetical protein
LPASLPAGNGDVDALARQELLLELEARLPAARINPQGQLIFAMDSTAARLAEHVNK